MNKDVYLNSFDIDENGKLPISSGTNKAEQLNLHLIYFFYHSLLADRVYIQGSAALKSEILYHVYHQFSDCFHRDEKHSGNPLASFVLSDDVEGYYDYFRNREESLKKNEATSTAEYSNYKENNALEKSVKLDRKLSSVKFKRKDYSVDKKFRYLVKVLFLDESFCKKYNISNKTQENAIYLCDNLDLFQTYKLLEELGLYDNKDIAHEIRLQYFIANGFSVSSTTTLAEDNFKFKFINVRYFFNALGLSPKRVQFSLLNSEAIFKIRRLPSFQMLKDYYFSADSDQELKFIMKSIIGIKNKKKYELLWSESPKAFIAGIFEELAESEILPRFVSMPMHEVSKHYSAKLFNKNTAFDAMKVLTLLREFEDEVDGIKQSLTG